MQIPRPSDLKNLCLASKQLSQLATPRLYQYLNLPYDENDKEWEKLHILANSRGILAGHVRAINIGACDYTEQRACKPLRSLIESLPRHTLRFFQYSPLARPQNEDLKLLWRTQKRLTNLHFDFARNSPPSSDILRENSLELRSLVSVTQIYFHFEAGAPDPPTMDFLKTMADIFPNLKRLTLDFTPDISTELTIDEPVLPATVLSRCLPRTLTHISFCYVRINHAGELDKLTVLKHLELVKCDSVEMLLDNYSRPALETFIYRHDCIEQTRDTVTSIAVLEFLQRFKQLQRLIIDCHDCLTNLESTAASSITNHAASLKHLLINCETTHIKGSYEGSFLEAASKCKRLKQLSISFCVSDNIELGAVRRKRGYLSPDSHSLTT